MAIGRRGTILASHAVGATILAGFSTYALLALVSRSLDSAAFDDFSVFWSMALIIGFGLFLPFEQELARWGGDVTRVTIASAWRISLLLALLVLAAIAATLPFALTEAGIPVSALVGLAAIAVVSPLQFVTRGLLLAQDRGARFSNVLVGDAVLRVALVAVVAAAAAWTGLDGASTVLFMLAIAVAIAVSHALGWPRDAAITPGVPQPSDTRFRRHVVALIGPSLIAQLIINAAPIVVFAFGAVGAAGAFQATFAIARLPLFLITPLQAMLVRPLVGVFRRHDGARAARAILLFALALSAAAVVGGGAGYLLGPWATELVFGPGRSLPGIDVALLVAAVILHAGLIVMTQVAVATSTHRAATWSWLIALAGAVIGFAVSFPFAPVEMACGIALLTSSVAGFIAATTFSRVHLFGRDGAVDDEAADPGDRVAS